MDSAATPQAARPGVVYLVGAGPGDPDLITVKGLRLLRQADVIVYDRLANPLLLEEARPDAELIYVGKEATHHARPQDEINALLVERGRRGQIVVRLKGGDPFVFGRGGEEAEALVAAGVRFEVVPGVTSAIAVPAYAGIPVTHRDYTTTFTVVTGHADPTTGASQVPWASLAAGGGTLVFLMGVQSLPGIAERLLAAGLSTATPAATIQWGTMPAQRVVAGTLGTIAARVRAAGLGPPAVTVVGAAAGLHESLAWLERRPLAGRRVLVTRAQAQASSISALLRSRGAEPLEFPVIEIAPAADYSGLDTALAAAGRYEWAIFTSANAVDAVGERLHAAGTTWAAFQGVRVCAIGPKTAAKLRAAECAVEVVPRRFVAEAILEELPPVDGQRVLLARADIADRRLADGLRERGALVDEYVAYRTLVSDQGDDEVRRLLLAGDVDVVTFASSSTVRNLRAVLGEDGFARALQGTIIACIGPITAATARELGLTPHVVAATHTIEGLLEALEDYVAGTAGPPPGAEGQRRTAAPRLEEETIDE
jgi:uroporphyrinogen III methyltransferase/synthase